MTDPTTTALEVLRLLREIEALQAQIAAKQKEIDRLLEAEQ